VANAVPTSEKAMSAMPPIIAGLRARSANAPAARAPTRSATAGAEMTMPLTAEERPMALPYSGSVGMTVHGARARARARERGAPGQEPRRARRGG